MVNERSLNPPEEGIYLLNQYSGCFSLATISHLQGQVNIDKLQRSIDLIQDQHDILRCKIIRENNELKFRLKEPNTAKVSLEIIEDCQDKSWENWVIKYLNQPLALEKYLFRCFLIIPSSTAQESYFVTIVCHSISDGLSSVELHRSIFKNYENIVNNKIQRKVSLGITSKYEQIFNKKSHQFSNYLRAILSVIKLQVDSVFLQPQKLKPEQIISLQKRKGRFSSYCLDKKTTQKIIIKSKQENITVNSLLTAAISLAIADEIKTKKEEEITLYCQCYVDLRQRLNPNINNEHLEILISSLMSFYTIRSHGDVVSLGKEVNYKIKKELEKQDFLYYPLLLKQIVTTSIKNTQNFTPTFGISNLGKINLEKNYGDFTLENISFVPNICIYDHSLSLSISTFNNRMTINFSFSHPSFSSKRIDKIAQSMFKILENTE